MNTCPPSVRTRSEVEFDFGPCPFYTFNSPTGRSYCKILPYTATYLILYTVRTGKYLPPANDMLYTIKKTQQDTLLCLFQLLSHPNAAWSVQSQTEQFKSRNSCLYRMVSSRVLSLSPRAFLPALLSGSYPSPSSSA